MPPAKVFHQNAGWLKAEERQIFSDCWKCRRHNFFWSIAPSYFYVEDNCHLIYFSPASLISTPQKHDIFGDGATVFYKLANPPIDVSVPTPILHPGVCAAFIYLFHPPTRTRTYTHAHRHMCTQACPTPTYTWNPPVCSLWPRLEASSLNLCRFCFSFFIRIRWAPWSHLIHSEDLQCRLPSLRCLLARARVEAALFMMRGEKIAAKW